MTLEMGKDYQIIRLTDKSQAEECVEIMRGVDTWETLRIPFYKLADIFMEPMRETHLAVREGKIIGLVMLRMDGPFVGYIQLLSIHPDWQGKGVGPGLIGFAEERIFKDSPNVFICASSFNPKALNLYRSLGYEDVGPLKNYVVRGHDEILLRKTKGSIREFQPLPY